MKQTQRSYPIQIVGFKRDLRIKDKGVLSSTSARGPALPPHIVEPKFWRQPQASARHWSFIAHCLRSLHRDLSRLTRSLALGIGDAIATLDSLHELSIGRLEHGQYFRACLKSFLRRLHWHCHFTQVSECDPSIEFIESNPAMRNHHPAPINDFALAAWENGQTGFPFLGAGMRSLRATGWLNFRRRAMVRPFAADNLGLHWRTNCLRLARLFVDYEPGVHWPQVQMQSRAVGINPIHIYNPVKQGYDQDPAGLFTHRGLPELPQVPDAFLHEPGRRGGAKTVLDCGYPRRITDWKTSSQLAKNRIFACRRGDQSHDDNRTLLMRQARRRGWRKSSSSKSALQMKFDFWEGVRCL